MLVGVTLIVSELSIEKWVYGGDGLARADGQVVLVPYVLPGEQVRVDVTGLHSQLLEIIQPQPERTAAPCPVFTRCGGCQYQHAGYEFQVARKQSILLEQLRRIGKIEYSGQIASATGPDYAYRNRSQFHIAGGKIGYYAPGSHDVIDVEQCPISSPKINESLTALRRMIRDRRFPRFLQSLELFTDETHVQVNVIEAERPVARRFFEWCAEEIPGYIDQSLEYTAAGEVFRVGHSSFFQVNRFLIHQLVNASIGEESGDTAVDLYAGVGLFAVKLAKRFQKVIAVESGAAAVRDLDYNATRAKVQVLAFRDQVDDYLTKMDTPPDFIVADPPRSGLGKRVVEQLLRLRPKRVVVVSCDPATLARDLAGMLSGGYEIQKLTLVDLFPQTFHLETIATLQLS